jgi:hypothetical protein
MIEKLGRKTIETISDFREKYETKLPLMVESPHIGPVSLIVKRIEADVIYFNMLTEGQDKRLKREIEWIFLIKGERIRDMTKQHEFNVPERLLSFKARLILEAREGLEEVGLNFCWIVLHLMTIPI